MISHRYSHLFTYFKCPKYFELKNIHNLPDGSDKNAELQFGTAMHLAIDSLFDGIDGINVFEEYWVNVKNLEFGRLKHDDLLSLGKSLLSIFKEETMHRIKPIRREERLEVTYEDIKVGGTPDQIALFDDVLSVVDFKTSALPYDAYKIVCDAQMSLYADMTEKVHGDKPVQGVYIVLIKDMRNPRIQIRKQPFSESFVKNHVDNFLMVCKDIEERAAKGNWPKNSASCKTYAGVCPYWSKCYEGT